MSSDDLVRAYSRLLAWYSPQWRDENGQAMLGALLDRADTEGHRSVPAVDRIGLVIGGLRERAFAPQRPGWPNVVALCAAAAFSVLYFTIVWAPGLDYPGTVGPFTNGSVITCALLIAAFVLTLLSRHRQARVLVLAGMVTELVVGVLSNSLGWLGPSWSTVILFTGLAILSVWPLHRVRSAVAAAAVLVTLIAAAMFTSPAVNLLLDMGTWAPAVTITALTGIVLIAVVSGFCIHAIIQTTTQKTPRRPFP